MIKRMPGFRSGVWWKSLMAVVVYLFVALIVLGLVLPADLSLTLEKPQPTNKDSSSITGRTKPGQEVDLLKDNNLVQSVKAESDGRFVFSLNNLSEGNHIYQVRLCRGSKKEKCVIETVGIVIDQTSPSQPSLAIPKDLPENGWDEIVIKGTAELGSKVEISYADLDLRELEVDKEGNFSFNTRLEVGGHLLKAKSIDEAGNESEEYVTTINFEPIRTKAKVYRVVDGDTIKIDEGKVPVRYIGIEAPETVCPSKPIECYGKEASEKNKELVEGKEVILEKDVSKTDRYGRWLRYVWLGDVLVNELLVKEGYAQSISYPPDIKYQERLVEAERSARKENRGLWEECNASS